MKIAIVSIGNEVLSGKTINTNASYISKQLVSYGHEVVRHVVIRDEKDEIIKSLDECYQYVNIVITTGGLGPTVDDITKETVCEYFNEDTVINDNIVNKINAYFKAVNKETPENNIKQAMFPKTSIILNNDNGTAPGMILEKNNQTIILLPGPPHEMKPMFEKEVIPYLTKDPKDLMLRKSFRIMGIGESHAETMINDLYDKYPLVNIAPYASLGEVEYILSTKAIHNEEFDKCCNDFNDLLNDYVVSTDGENIADVIGKLLIDNNLTVSTAESCTGGMLAAKIIDYPGISEVFNEAFVTYSNESKVKYANVSKDTLEKYGAVSEQTAEEMAEGIAKNTNSDIGLSTTGIAGPSGGTLEKPVGLVYTAIHFKGHTYVYKHNFNGDRSKIRYLTTMNVLYALFKVLKDNVEKQK